MTPKVNLVTSYEVSKKLEALGVDQKSFFCWAQWGEEVFVMELGAEAAPGERFLCYAYTAQELGDIFRDKIRKCFEMSVDYEHICWLENEADERGKLIVQGLERELISV